MKELAEFRVDEDFVSKLFADNEGKCLGSVRKIELTTDDPRFKRIGELQREIIAKTDRLFFYGWNIRRQYSKAELAEASCFDLRSFSVFEPAGEECGTEYDASSGCPHCGAGAKQVGSLILNVKHIPKGRDIAQTIAGEIVVSRRLVELFKRQGITGVAMDPLRMSVASSAESKDWFQLNVQSTDAEIVAPTRVGIDPFDDDIEGECRCPQGDLIGLNLLSEVTIRAVTRGEADFVSSRQFIGVRRGLLRPERVIFVSPRVKALMESEKVKGCKFEVTQLV